MFKQFTVCDVSDSADQSQRQPGSPIGLLLSVRSSTSPRFSKQKDDDTKFLAKQIKTRPCECWTAFGKAENQMQIHPYAVCFAH